MERKWRSRIIRCMDSLHKIYFIERKATWRMYMGNMQRKSKAKNKWAVEKPKLDNARRLRGIFFIEPKDEEFEHTMKESLKFRCQQQCLVRHQQIAAGNLRQYWETQDQTCLYCRCRRIYENTIGRCAPLVSRRSHLCKRNKFIEPLQFGNKNTGCEGGSGQIMWTSEKVPAWQKRGDRRSEE